MTTETTTNNTAPTAPAKLYSFDDFPHHRDFLPKYRDWGIHNALRTDPMSEQEKQLATTAVIEMYALTGRKAPKVLFADGPISGAFAACFVQAFIEYGERPASLVLTGHKTTDSVVKVLAQFFDMEPTKAPAKPYKRQLHKWNTQDGSFRALAATFGKVGELALIYAPQVRDAYYQAGQQSSDYCSFYSFMQEVAQLPIDWNPFRIYKALCVNAGERYVAEDFCVLCDRPLTIKKDEQNQPHSETGPFTAWADGIKLYAWHGQYIPAEFIECKDTIDASRAFTEENTEHRRALAEILGWSRVLKGLDCKIIDTDSDPEIGELIEVDLPTLGRSRFIRVRCGTGREFVLPVPPDQETALEANAWTYGISQDDLKLKEFRT